MHKLSINYFVKTNILQLKIKTLQRRAEFQSQHQQEPKATETQPAASDEKVDADAVDDNVDMNSPVEPEVVRERRISAAILVCLLCDVVLNLSNQKQKSVKNLSSVCSLCRMNNDNSNVKSKNSSNKIINSKKGNVNGNLGPDNLCICVTQR